MKLVKSNSTYFLTLLLCLSSAIAKRKVEVVTVVTQSAEEFSSEFFKKISAAYANKNVITSPLSAHVVLSMAAYGARGQTSNQMRQSLHLPENNTITHQGFEGIIKRYQNVKSVVLKVANKIYVAKGMKLEQRYKHLTARTFKSEASELEVDRPTKAAQYINHWVGRNTNDKIHDIIVPSDIDASTRLIMLNAVYFKGEWLKSFDKKLTVESQFHITEEIQKNVSTMFTSGSFMYGELTDLKAKFIEVPYKNGDFKLVVIVPNDINGLDYVIQNSTALKPEYLAKSASKQEVHLYLPKFKIESTIDLKEPLEKLGMTNMFENTANFSGIAKESLQVSKVLQKAFIEVNEHGSEAAAATSINFVLSAAPVVPVAPIEFKADKPFLFQINDNKLGLTLFTGTVNDPKI
ncbi:hypothetical protein QAD02_017622 [Eretmocerus hayati]|uniref:Uncharacterized protein n=1 Tax=Eretmocerus hayati TaxID=131215 RepID=A0ACC2PEH3_9HYME|nr:hypothetical protein QAD02_017622 [Eretmocerus hayati]